MAIITAGSKSGGTVELRSGRILRSALRYWARAELPVAQLGLAGMTESAHTHVSRTVHYMLAGLQEMAICQAEGWVS